MTQPIVLSDVLDPTVFMACSQCNRKGNGVPVGQYYCIAFTKADARKKEVKTCPNCQTPLTTLYQVT